MKKSYILYLVLVMFSLTACVTTNAIKLGTPQVRPPVPMEEVAVYMNPGSVPGKYEEVALLNSTGDAMWGGEAKMIKSMKKKAGKIGANAIILNDIDEPKAIEKIIGSYLGTITQRKGKALAIYLVPDENE